MPVPLFIARHSALCGDGFQPLTGGRDAAATSLYFFKLNTIC